MPLELGASPDSLNQKNPFLALIPHSTSFKCKTDCALCAFLTLEGHLLLVGYETQVVGCYWQKKKENTRKYQCAWHDFGFDFIYIMCVCVCVHLITKQNDFLTRSHRQKKHLKATAPSAGSWRAGTKLGTPLGHQQFAHILAHRRYSVNTD